MRNVAHPLLALGVLLMLLPGRAAAQDPAAVAQEPPAGTLELVDRVLAVVGDSVILQSEVQEQLIDLQRAGQALPQDPVAMERLMREILDGMVEELVLVQAALGDSIEVQQQQIERMVDQDLERRAQSFGGRRALEQALAAEGLSHAEYRDMLLRQYQRRELIQTFLATQRDRALPPVTEEELRSYFDEQRERFDRLPARVTFKQVVVAPQASDSARAEAREEIEDIRRQIQAGGDFASLARRHSDDPGTREQGGDLGWFRQGRMVEAFDRAVFGMRPGQVSEIVATPFGFHIIRLERVKGAERQARHILVQPSLNDADIARAESIAERVAQQLRAGAPVDSLIALHHDATEQSEVGPFRRDQLPSPYDETLAEAGRGDVVGPVRLDSGGLVKWAVVRVEDVLGAGEMSFEDARAGLRRELQQQKLIEEVVQELRRRMHVDIRL